VSVHDVAPTTIDEVRWLLARLDAAGVTRRVLKVIPGEPVGDPAADPARQAVLAELVTAEAQRGSEIVLHGWTHRATRPIRGSAADRLRARLFAGDAPEFLALDRPAMDERLRAGLAWLAALGVTPTGFCAPAWLAAPELAPAARAAGFRYLVWLRGLRDLRSGSWLTLPPIGYLGAGRGQEVLVRLGGALLSRPLHAALRSPAHRIVLHPQRAVTSRACHRVLEAVAALGRRHRAVTYAELLDG